MTVTTTDSGYAWVILLASVGCNYVTGVLVYFVGVIHVELLIKFQEDVTTTAWVGAMYSSLQMLGEYSRTHGTTSHQAATLFVGSGIFSLVSRLGSGLLLTSSRVNSFALSVGLMTLCGAATCLFPVYSDTYLGQMVFASIFGLSTGGFFTLINVLTIELVDVTSLPAAYGVLIFMMGIGWVVGPPMAGMIVDSGGTYEHSFIFLGIAMFASAGFDLLAKVLHSRKSKQRDAISSLHDVSNDALKDH